MRITKHFKTIVVLTLLGSLNTLFAETEVAVFEIEAGSVVYDISGGAQLTPETNLSVKGTAVLHFKEWGEVKVEEVNGLVKIEGAIEYQEPVKRFQKETKESIITVDFKNEQLLERKKSSVKKDLQNIQTNHLEKKGTESVAGVLCDVWEGIGLKKCIYKGIILKLESYVYDVSYVKVATKVNFDVNRTEDCVLPDYPLHKFGLFRDNIKTKNVVKSENFCKVINDAVDDIEEHNQSYTVNNFNDPKRTKFINRISQDIFEKQKILLPQLFKSMKKMRECLQTVENSLEANQCIESFTTMKSKLGFHNNDQVILWDEKRKSKILDQVEDDIIELGSNIACVKRAKNMTDLSNCMK